MTTTAPPGTEMGLGRDGIARQPRGDGAPVLEISDFSVVYRTPGGDVRAVDRVNLVLNAGEVVGLAGESGSGKSTLAYACARAGWTFTSDDASYLLWESADLDVRGNSHQVRFRPSARELFPELQGRSLTPRAAGKPSIEVFTAELPGIVTAKESQVHYIVLLNRRISSPVELTPLTREEMLPQLDGSLFAEEWTPHPRAKLLERLCAANMYELRYSDFEGAIGLLERLVRGDLR